MSATDDSIDGKTKTDQSKGKSQAHFAKWLTTIGIVIAFFTVWRVFGNDLSLNELAEREDALRQYGADNPLLVIGIAFSIYVVVTGLAIPGAVFMTLAIGWYFRFATGLVLVSFASTAGGTLAFLLSRYLLRDLVVGWFGTRTASFNEALRQEGPFYLFTLRLVPVIPFFVVNVVMGLTPIKTSTYWWVSQIGMLPGTAVFVYAGSQFPDLRTLAENGPNGILSPSLVAALVMLGLFPWVARRAVAMTREAL